MEVPDPFVTVRPYRIRRLPTTIAAELFRRLRLVLDGTDRFRHPLIW